MVPVLYVHAGSQHFFELCLEKKTSGIWLVERMVCAQAKNL